MKRVIEERREFDLKTHLMFIDDEMHLKKSEDTLCNTLQQKCTK